MRAACCALAAVLLCPSSSIAVLRRRRADRAPDGTSRCRWRSLRGASGMALATAGAPLPLRACVPAGLPAATLASTLQAQLRLHQAVLPLVMYLSPMSLPTPAPPHPSAHPLHCPPRIPHLLAGAAALVGGGATRSEEGGLKTGGAVAALPTVTTVTGSGLRGAAPLPVSRRHGPRWGCNSAGAWVSPSVWAGRRGCPCRGARHLSACLVACLCSTEAARRSMPGFELANALRTVLGCDPPAFPALLQQETCPPAPASGQSWCCSRGLAQPRRAGLWLPLHRAAPRPWRPQRVRPSPRPTHLATPSP